MWFQLVGQSPETIWAGFVMVKQKENVECMKEMCASLFLCASKCVLPSSTSGTAAAVATLGLLESHKSLLFLKEQQMKKAVYDSAWWRDVGHCFLYVGVFVLLIHSGTFLVVCPWVCVLFCVDSWFVLRPHCPGSACSVRELECACGRRVASLWPVPTASSLWNAWHSRCLPNKLLKKDMLICFVLI